MLKKLSKKKNAVRLAREIELILVNHMASGECETSKMSSEITKLVVDVVSGRRILAKSKETEKAICGIIHARPLSGQVHTVVPDGVEVQQPQQIPHPMVAALAAAFEDYKARKLEQQQEKENKPTDLFPGFPGNFPGFNSSNN